MPHGVAAALRDGVLQDLLAVSMLLSAARTRLGEAGARSMHELLENAQVTLETDLDQLRDLIAALDGDSPARR